MLEKNNISYVGAGSNKEDAECPLFISFEKTSERLVIFSCGHESAGIPENWKATSSRPGIFLLNNSNVEKNILRFQKLCTEHQVKQTDLKILLVHDGPNWVDKLDENWKEFTFKLERILGFHIIMNSSSHHILKNRQSDHTLIIEGPGDFLNDYYGIDNLEHKKFKPDHGKIVHVELALAHWKILKMVDQTFERIGFNLYPI